MVAYGRSGSRNSVGGETWASYNFFMGKRKLDERARHAKASYTNMQNVTGHPNGRSLSIVSGCVESF